VRIVVASNCQVGGLTNALWLLLPGAQVDAIHYPDMVGDARAKMLDVMRAADVVVVTAPSAWVDALEAEPGMEHVPILTAPEIHFDAFHPDTVFAWLPGGELVVCPAEPYNSAIAVWAWRHGLDADRTLSLFTPETFRQLGYEDRWARATARLQADFALHPGFDALAFLQAVRRSGAFMHTVNHPRIGAIAELARQVAARLGASAAELDEPVADFVTDGLTAIVSPVYPSIGAALGLPGSFTWRLRDGRVIRLEEFLAESFQMYAELDPAGVSCAELTSPVYDRILGRAVEDLRLMSATGRRAGARAVGVNPYSGLPAERFWSQSVALAPPGGIDPVGPVRFQIGRDDRVATMGSCFAQHISRHLESSGYPYFVTEDAPAGMADEEARAHGYRVFSARYGNVYTVRQARQLFDRAFGAFSPVDEMWPLGDRFVDPFRPRIEPDGFATPGALLADRAEHLDAVRRVFVEGDVLVFTLGLTEGWESTSDGAVVPLAPGVHGGDLHDGTFRFVNFTAAEVVDDLDALVARVRSVNPTCRILLTVSPVPLVATYDDRHVLVSNAISKAVLRVAADEVTRNHDCVEYFPSYEIIAGSAAGAGYFEPDLRSVSERGVGHVMRVFAAHLLQGAADEAEHTLAEHLWVPPPAAGSIVCDEETIETVMRAASLTRIGR
jgi:hypothetical protein